MQSEIPTRYSQTHLNTVLTKEVPAEYISQITWQLACTKRKWCDFVSFDPRLPEYLQLVIIRVFAKDLDIAGIEQSVIRFNQKIDRIIAELNPNVLTRSEFKEWLDSRKVA